MLVLLSHHGTAAIPSTMTHDVHLLGQEGIRRSHNGADIHVVLEVLDRHVEGMSALIQVGDDGLHRPEAIPIDDIARVSVLKQLRIEPRIRIGVHALTLKGPAAREWCHDTAVVRP